MAMGHLVEAKFIPARFVSSWPVATKSGTADGLRVTYGIATVSSRRLEIMLSELYHRLRAQGHTTNRDSLNTIGAALCWQGRRKKHGHGVHRSRYEVTTSSSETELRILSELGLAIRVFEDGE